MKNEQPLVTVVAICYNHADNLERALDSILCQRTDFPFKVVVLDDASTDGSQDIIRRYASKDSRIEPVLHEENLHRQGRKMFVEYQDKITSPFFHVLETDDYWCDPDKLQRQVDALRAHPECIACAHAVEYRDAGCNLLMVKGRKVKGGAGVLNIYSTQFCHMSTTLYRNFLSEIPQGNRKFLCRDIGRFYYALSMGKLFYFDKPMSVTRRTGTGVWSSLDEETRASNLQELYYLLDRLLGFRFTKKFRPMYLPHEGRTLFSFCIPYFRKGRRLLVSVAKLKLEE